MKTFLFFMFFVASNGFSADTLPFTYDELNPAIVVSQNNGGKFAVGTSFTGAKTWSVTWPNQLVSLTSGTFGQYSTIAKNAVSNERYGQIMVTLGKDQDMWVRLALFGQANPQFTSQEGACGGGADVIWCPSRDLKYRSNNNLVVSGFWPSITAYHNLTINYDLVSDTYEIWLNSNKVAGPVAFDSPLVSAGAIGLGGTYRGSTIAVLRYWHWITSDSSPFTSAGSAQNDSICSDVWTSENGLTADLNQDCYVNFQDFSIFVKAWLECNNPSDPDCQ